MICLQSCVCTERNVLFDRVKVASYFQITEPIKVDYDSYEEEYWKYSLIQIDYPYLRTRAIFDKRIYNLTQFFIEYQQIVFDELSFEEMNSFTVTAEELFECSAKIHFRNQSNQIPIENCFKKFHILKSVYANNDFGICYSFFKKNYSINLKEEDNIEILIKHQAQDRFIMSGVFKNSQLFDGWGSITNLNYFKYFKFYYVVENQGKYGSMTKETAVSTNRIGLRSIIKLKKTSVELLSKPHMEYCETNDHHNMRQCFER